MWRPQAHTTFKLITNMNKNIAEAVEAALILCQVARQYIFHPVEPAFLTPVPTNGARWTALPAGANALAGHTITDTSAPDTAMPAAAGIIKTIQTAYEQQKVLP